MKLKPFLDSVPGRLGLIAAVAGVIVVLAVYQVQAIIGRADRSFSLSSGPPVFQPASDSTFVRSYPVIVNGQRTQFGHYRSPHTAREVVDEYIGRAARAGSDPAPHPLLPVLRSHGAGCSTYSYLAADGSHVNIVAFDNAQSKGAEYFVGSVPEAAAKSPTRGDCPGREPPGVSKPSNATRTLSIQNLGGLPSVLNFYELWGQPSGILADMRQDLRQNGWTEREQSSSTLSKNFDGVALLSFARNREQCLLAIDHDPKSGKLVLMMFWAERPWFPEGVAL